MAQPKQHSVGDTWLSESGATIIMLRSQPQPFQDGTDTFMTTASLADNAVHLSDSSGLAFTLLREEALLLHKAIQKKWPLDALGQV